MFKELTIYTNLKKCNNNCYKCRRQNHLRVSDVTEYFEKKINIFLFTFEVGISKQERA